MVLTVEADNAPFSDVALPQGGMVVDIAKAAIAQSPSPLDVRLVWQNGGRQADASLPLEAYLPTPAPECGGVGRTSAQCAARYYSDPLAEIVILLFVPVSASRALEAPEARAGLRLCYRAALDVETGLEFRPRWLSETGVEALPAVSLTECFRRLDAGEVDAVAADEFRGILALFHLGLTDTVVPLSDPVGVEGLHVSVPKTHWRATAQIYRLNAGLAALRRSGAYSEIVARHTEAFWDRLKK